jgi:hypothetical protein
MRHQVSPPYKIIDKILVLYIFGWRNVLEDLYDRRSVGVTSAVRCVSLFVFAESAQIGTRDLGQFWADECRSQPRCREYEVWRCYCLLLAPGCGESRAMHCWDRGRQRELSSRPFVALHTNILAFRGRGDARTSLQHVSQECIRLSDENGLGIFSFRFSVKIEMGGACGTYGGEEKCMHGLVGKP